MVQPVELFAKQADKIFLSYAGMETDIIFNKGVDLPGFAAFPLLESEEGRKLMRESYQATIDLAREMGCGLFIESPTWIANIDRARDLGYDQAALDRANEAAIAFTRELRDAAGEVPLILSGNIGPRGDAYEGGAAMTAEEAEAYHETQIAALAKAGAEVISAFTMTNAPEAIGIVRAAQKAGLPVVISFTVETDGKLPNGQALKDAIAEVDRQTAEGAAHFLINCAHPDHFTQVLDGGAWMRRLGGMVVNASRCSHAELDEAEELDAGDPAELGEQLGALHRRFPHLRVFGGCCGTDIRHMREITRNVTAH